MNLLQKLRAWWSRVRELSYPWGGRLPVMQRARDPFADDDISHAEPAPLRDDLPVWMRPPPPPAPSAAQIARENLREHMRRMDAAAGGVHRDTPRPLPPAEVHAAAMRRAGAVDGPLARCGCGYCTWLRNGGAKRPPALRDEVQHLRRSDGELAGVYVLRRPPASDEVTLPAEYLPSRDPLATDEPQAPNGYADWLQRRMAGEPMPPAELASWSSISEPAPLDEVRADPPPAPDVPADPQP